MSLEVLILIVTFLIAALQAPHPIGAQGNHPFMQQPQVAQVPQQQPLNQLEPLIRPQGIYHLQIK
jgi:hypothetical protein